MASIQGLSSVAASSAFSTQSTSRTHRHPHNDQGISQSTLAQDLSQSGLKTGVSTDTLLTDIQASIQSALSDPKNAGQDPFQVLQAAVQQTLKDNGVDTEKLAALLQSQSPGGIGAPSPGSAQAHRHHARAAQPPTAGGSDPDGDGDAFAKPKSTIASGSVAGSITASSLTSSANSTQSNSSGTAADSPLRFQRLIVDLIKSLPSGSAVDVKV